LDPSFESRKKSSIRVIESSLFFSREVKRDEKERLNVAMKDPSRLG